MVSGGVLCCFSWWVSICIVVCFSLIMGWWIVVRGGMESVVVLMLLNLVMSIFCGIRILVVWNMFSVFSVIWLFVVIRVEGIFVCSSFLVVCCFEVCVKLLWMMLMGVCLVVVIVVVMFFCCCLLFGEFVGLVRKIILLFLICDSMCCVSFFIVLVLLIVMWL